jgi:hypothetical protein
LDGCGTSLPARQGIANTVVKRIQALPNPTSGQLTLILQPTKAGRVQIRLFEIIGKLVLQQWKQVAAGVQTMDVWQRKPARGYSLQVNKKITKIVVR